jgi:sarcosine oxidase subunit alpha
MPEQVTISINGCRISIQMGATVSAAILTAGEACRVSLAGEPRTALCGMGICFECRAVVDGMPHTRTCQLLCKENMQVETRR